MALKTLILSIVLFRMHLVIAFYDTILLDWISASFFQGSMLVLPSTELEVYVHNFDEGISTFGSFFLKASTNHFYSHCFQTGRWDNSCVRQIVKFIILHLPCAQNFFSGALEHYLWMKIFTSLYTIYIEIVKTTWILRTSDDRNIVEVIRVYLTAYNALKYMSQRH